MVMYVSKIDSGTNEQIKVKCKPQEEKTGRIVGMLLDPEGDARQFENLKRELRKEAWEEGREEGKK